MKQSQKISTKHIVLASLMAALTVVGSAIRITMPVSIAGTTSFHLGNIFCALSGILLGPWMGGLAAGLGSALYDLTNPLYISDCWITFLTKGAYGVAAGLVVWSGKGKWNYGKATLGTIAGALTYAALYLAKSYYYSGILKHGLTPEGAMIDMISKVPATIFNAAVAILFTPMLAVTIREALRRNRITLD